MKVRAMGLLGAGTLLSLVAALLCVSAISSTTRSQSKETSAASSQTEQKAFATPQDAVDALIQAAVDFNVPSLLEILGPDGKDLVSSADPVADKQGAEQFASRAQEKHSVAIDPKNPRKAIVLVGKDDWPGPIPIVERNGKWYFDSKAGREEVLFRRIGANELDAIEVCRGFVEAQEEYALTKHDDSEVNQYAQKIISTPGKQDGLAWQNSDGTWGGPVGEGAAKALEEGYSEKGQPFHGYYFKVLKGQGPAAPLGRMDFMVNGAMIAGFALAAAPAQYRVTGVQTFIVSYEGVVYQKDLGPDTLKVFKEMELYNPDKTWKPTSDDWTGDVASGLD
jgi:hypothetical protein